VEREGPGDAGVVDLERMVRLGQEHLPVVQSAIDVVKKDVHPAILVVVDRRAEIGLKERRIRRLRGKGHHGPFFGEGQRR
jgi:hypothetical protein